MALHPKIADVTARIEERSGDTRRAYLDRIDAARNAGPGRQHLSCGNLAHAFAAVPLAYAAELGVPLEKINVNGGAIALGHPVGATGARLVLTSLKELKRQNLKRALVSVCVGGGQGAAIWLEAL